MELSQLTRLLTYDNAAIVAWYAAFLLVPYVSPNRTEDKR